MIAELYVKSMLSLVRNLQTVFQGSCAILYSYGNEWEFQVLYMLVSIWCYHSVLDFGHSSACVVVSHWVFFNCFFYTGVELIDNVVLLSAVQQSDSVIHIHVFILFQILFPFRLLHNIEQSSLYYTVGHCWLSILSMVVCTCQSHTS